MDYFSQKQLIAAVDKNDTILYPIDRWEAHKKKILHRGFTIAITYQDDYIFQHRKHPVFDRVFDITISSHQIFQGKNLQDDVGAIYNTLEREWNIKQSDLSKEPIYNGKIYYQSPDPLSIYTEHEICHFYTCEIKKLTLPNFDFAYGFTLIKKSEIQNKNNPIHTLLAPWIKKAIEEHVL